MSAGGYGARQTKYGVCRRSRCLTNAERLKLCEDLDAGPRKFGYPSNGWTGSLFSQHIAKVTGLRVSVHTARRLMRQHGLVWTPADYASVTGGGYRMCRVAKQMIADAIRDRRPAWFADETRIQLARDPWGSWQPRTGIHSAVRRVTHNGGDVTLMGAVRDDGALVCRRVPSVSGERFVGLLLRIFSRGDCIVVADGAAYHRSRRVREFLEKHSGLDLRLLPPRTSHVSPIEPVWDMLRACVDIGDAAVTADKLAETVLEVAGRWAEPNHELGAVVRSFGCAERRGAGGPVYE
jgi:hypothetical protein